MITDYTSLIMDMDLGIIQIPFADPEDRTFATEEDTDANKITTNVNLPNQMAFSMEITITGIKALGVWRADGRPMVAVNLNSQTARLLNKSFIWIEAVNMAQKASLHKAYIDELMANNVPKLTDTLLTIAMGSRKPQKKHGLQTSGRPTISQTAME